MTFFDVVSELLRLLELLLALVLRAFVCLLVHIVLRRLKLLYPHLIE